MAGPPPDLLKEIDDRRKALEDDPNQSWMLVGINRIKKYEFAAVIARIDDGGVPHYHETKIFQTERAAREYVAFHNERFESNRVRKPLPRRTPTVININGNEITARPEVIPTPDDDEGWYDQNRDYKKNPPVFDYEFELSEGKDGITVRRPRREKK